MPAGFVTGFKRLSQNLRLQAPIPTFGATPAGFVTRSKIFYHRVIFGRGIELILTQGFVPSSQIVYGILICIIPDFWIYLILRLLCDSLDASHRSRNSSRLMSLKAAAVARTSSAIKYREGPYPTSSPISVPPRTTFARGGAPPKHPQ